jgi:hypothetical protein
MAIELTDDELAKLAQGIYLLSNEGNIEEEDAIALLTKIEEQHEGPCKAILDYLIEAQNKRALMNALYHVK